MFPYPQDVLPLSGARLLTSFFVEVGACVTAALTIVSPRTSTPCLARFGRDRHFYLSP